MNDKNPTKSIRLSNTDELFLGCGSLFNSKTPLHGTAWVPATDGYKGETNART